MFGAWVDVIEFIEIDRLISLVLADSTPYTLKEFLANKFHQKMKSTAITVSSFDEEATKLLIDLVRIFHEDQNKVYVMVKAYIYHTYMVVYHKMSDDEFRLLRHKLRKTLDPNSVY